MRTKALRLLLLAFLAAVATTLTLTAASGAQSKKRSDDSSKSTTTLKATLRGSNEVPGPGDPNGSGRAEVLLLPRFNAVCFRLSWKNIADPVAAHIHRGEKGESGDIVVPFSETSFRKRGCVDGVASDLLRQIKRRPGRFYVNIHTADFPSGAIRGQLKRGKSSK